MTGMKHKKQLFPSVVIKHTSRLKGNGWNQSKYNKHLKYKNNKSAHCACCEILLTPID